MVLHKAGISDKKVETMRQLILFALLFPIFTIAQQNDFRAKAIEILRPYVLKEATWALEQQPITITSFSSKRSAGGKHDFFSEGDYWWPDPQNPDGPYIQRDGMTNPDNFVEHRKAMIRFSRIIGLLASAYLLTGDEKYACHAFAHAKQWFMDTATQMNPHMLYAQAIKGRFTGRGIGIIDMIQFMEVSQALLKLEKSRSANKKEYVAYRKWFDEFLLWVNTHPYGLDEKKALNNHGTCWTMQVAAFAKFTNNKALLDTCRNRYKNIHLPDQMAADGSFPKELARTKPYGYSLFNLDAMAMICQILSNKKNDLWRFQLDDQRSIERGISFLYPYVSDKQLWPHKKDVMYWDEWPVAHPFLLFGANAFSNEKYFSLWERLEHAPVTEEVIRNLPVRHPLIWLD
jgi:hypothetical protein